MTYDSHVRVWSSSNSCLFCARYIFWEQHKAWLDWKSLVDNRKELGR